MQVLYLIQALYLIRLSDTGSVPDKTVPESGSVPDKTVSDTGSVSDAGSVSDKTI